MVKKYLIGISFLFILLVFSGCAQEQREGMQDIYIIEEPIKSVNVDIKAQGPFNSDERNIVWTYELELEQIDEADYVVLNFDELDFVGQYMNQYESVDLGECDLNAPDGYVREIIDDGMIQRSIQDNGSPDENGDISVGGIEVIPCGIVQEKTEIFRFLTKENFQKIYDEKDKYIQGDFLVIKNGKNEVLYIEFNQYTNPGNEGLIKVPIEDKIIFEIYASTDNNLWRNSEGFHLISLIYTKSLI
jgi:hypothetical protein